MLPLINCIKLIIRVVGREKAAKKLKGRARIGPFPWRIYFFCYFKHSTTRLNFSWIYIVSISIRLFSSFFIVAINIHPERLIRLACKIRLFVWRYLFALLIDSNVLEQIQSNNRRNTNFSIEKILYKIICIYIYIYKALRDNDRKIVKRQKSDWKATGGSEEDEHANCPLLIPRLLWSFNIGCTEIRNRSAARATNWRLLIN